MKKKVDLEELMINQLEMMWSSKDFKEVEIYSPVFSKCIGSLSQNGYDKDVLRFYVEEFIEVSNYFKEAN